ncbi:HAMP domain-containing histidine kinase, partial [Patescibacteria group bacterium]|nr:HAMP domain-containing histidine kinase [Patescibacteria group bacterium]
LICAVSKEDLPNIFDVYYKSKDTSIPGMGLGLFLCKNIIEAHRGSIHIKSALGKGTMVEIQLPGIKI